MSTTTRISFAVIVEGAVVGLDAPPKMESPGEEYGVKNAVTGGIITASGTDMTAIGNSWYYDVVDSAANTYRYYIKTEFNSALYYLGRTTELVASAVLAIGRYTDSLEIERQFGIDNLHKWLAIDNGDEPNDYGLRLYRFIRDTEAEIDDTLRGGPSSVPFSASSVPDVVRNIATALAGVRAYESRGVVDTNTDTGQVLHRLQFQSKWADRQLGRIKSGQIQLAVDTVTRHPKMD